MESSPEKKVKRPQSVMAQKFSADLDELFRMDDGVDVLVTNVESTKASVFTQSKELQDLEARLKEAENRLKTAATSSPPRKIGRKPLEEATTGPMTASSSKTKPHEELTSDGSATDGHDDMTATAPVHVHPSTPRSGGSKEYIMVDRPKA